MAGSANSNLHRSKPRDASTDRWSSVQKTASVASAKANLSALLSSVVQDREEITLSRRGIPIAKIVPLPAPQPKTGYGWIRGGAREVGDIVGPSGEEWTAADE